MSDDLPFTHCERISRIGSAPARLDSAQRFFGPPATFRRNFVSVRLALVFLLVPAEFLRRGLRRRVQLPVPLTPSRGALIVRLDRFRGAHESGFQLTPDRANHECAPIVSHVTAEPICKNSQIRLSELIDGIFVMCGAEAGI